jgi:hypothetical protein
LASAIASAAATSANWANRFDPACLAFVDPVFRYEIFDFAGEFCFEQGSVELSDGRCTTDAFFQAFSVFCKGIAERGEYADSGYNNSFHNARNSDLTGFQINCRFKNMDRRQK